MKRKPYFSAYLLGLGMSLAVLAQAQNVCILPDAGAMFRKQTHKTAPVVKTRYSFGVGATSGREYLVQQDLYDAKGKFKSGGTFSEDGNKATDLRYTYDASGVLQKKEVRFIGKNLKEVYLYTPAGLVERKEVRTKGDTLLTHTVYSYDEKGNPTQEEDFRGDKSLAKRIFEDKFNARGQVLETCHYALDSNGVRVAGSFPLTVNEYDDQGQILQTTVYNNRERRKMLRWVYYKYQLDNDYKIIKRMGYNEEQQEIERVELAYTDSSIQSVTFGLCSGCPSKAVEKKSEEEFVYNAFGELVREYHKDGEGKLVLTRSRRYDEFGNLTEDHTVRVAEPEKLIKNRTIFEYFGSESAATTHAAPKPKK